MTRVVFNFGFLIEEDISQKIVHLSEELCRGQNPVYMLGRNSLPHVTVLQFEDELSKAPELWARLQPISAGPHLIDFRGLVLDRWRNWDVVWLKVIRHEWLVALQAKAVPLLPEYSFVNATGARFEPHITLGGWDSKSTMDGIAIPADLINRASVGVRLGLGVSGPNFQYERELFSCSC